MKRITPAVAISHLILFLVYWTQPALAIFQDNSQSQAPSSASGTADQTHKPDSTSSAASATPGTGSAKKSRPGRHKVRTRKASGSATRKVVRNGGTQEPIVQIAPGMSDDQASQHRQGTAELLATTDANLKQLDGQQLDTSKQDVVKQIQTYVEQARTAEASGDLDRAHNLAVKAQLLSDDLVRHKVQ